MSGQQIIMNFTVPPSDEDIHVMASGALEALPEELLEFCDALAVTVEALPDESMQQEMDLDDPYDLLVVYKSGKEISPGIEKKTVNDDDALILYRRPILDLWCENGEDIVVVIRQIIIEEIGRAFNFTDDEIDEMTSQHYQGML